EVSPFASTLAAAVTAPTLHVWGAADGKTIGCFFSHGDGPASSLRSSTRTDGVILWDVATGKELRRRSFQTATPLGAAALRLASLAASGTVLMPERNWFARPSASHHIQLFSLETGEPQPIPGGGGAGITGVAIAGDRVAFTREGERAVGLWHWRGEGGLRRLDG